MSPRQNNFLYSLTKIGIVLVIAFGIWMHGHIVGEFKGRDAEIKMADLW